MQKGPRGKCRKRRCTATKNRLGVVHIRCQRRRKFHMLYTSGTHLHAHGGGERNVLVKVTLHAQLGFFNYKTCQEHLSVSVPPKSNTGRWRSQYRHPDTFGSRATRSRTPSR